MPTRPQASAKQNTNHMLASNVGCREMSITGFGLPLYGFSLFLDSISGFKAFITTASASEISTLCRLVWTAKTLSPIILIEELNTQPMTQQQFCRRVSKGLLGVESGNENFIMSEVRWMFVHGHPDNKLADLVDIVKSWIPRRTEPANLSRDFWMPDKSCRCTANSVPAPSDEPKAGPEDWRGLGPSLSPSPSATSLASTMSSCTCNSTGSTVSSIPYSTGPYQHVQYSSGLSPRQSAQMDSVAVKQDQITGGSSTNPIEDVAGPSANQYTFCINRSDDEDDEYGIYQSDSETRHFSQADEYYDAVNFDEIESVYGPHKVHPDGDDTKSTEHSQIPENFDTHSLEGIKNHREEAENNDNGHECEAPPPYRVECMHAEPVDFNNGILWLPPEPEDEEDDREAALFDDEDDGESTGEWGSYTLQAALVVGSAVARTGQVENLPVDTSKGGGMDPGGYVKVKCIACGHRSERWQLQRSIVHHPNVLLVEKSVSRFAQEYLLEKDISLVLNIKRPLLERISRCTGAQIVPSIDHLTSPKLGYCDIFHVEKFLEGHGSAGQDGKKLVKTLMFFEGCPKPLGCTILLKGANGDELKKVKHVIQSISTIPGFSSPATRTPQGSQTTREPKKSYNNRMSDGASSTNAAPICKLEVMQSTCFSDDPNSQTLYTDPASSPSKSCASCTSSSPSGQEYSVAYHNEAFSSCDCEEAPRQGVGSNHADSNGLAANQLDILELETLEKYNNNNHHESYRCRSCDMPSEAHVHCYTHRQGSLTISVKKLQGIALPGEREGKIWMWHRCLLCPRTNGFPPATRRVVMSDAAWGLSFGKFLELSFSNHAAASRVASCGHSLHRDCLRFYGILWTWPRAGLFLLVNSSSSCDPKGQEQTQLSLEIPLEESWVELTKSQSLRDLAPLLCTSHQVRLAWHLISYGFGGMVACFCYASIDVHSVYLPPPKLEFNSIFRSGYKRKQMRCTTEQNNYLLKSSLGSNNLQAGLSSSTLKLKEKPLTSVEKVVDMNVTSKAGGKVGPVSQPSRVHKGKDMDQGLNNRKEAEICLSSSSNVNDQSDPVESGKIVRRVLSDGQDPVESRNLVRRVLSDGHFPIMGNLSDTLDAAWAGESHAGSKTSKENGYLCADTVVVESFGYSRTSCSRLRNGKLKNSSWNAQKLGIICEYNPAYVLSFRELEHQGGARLLLPVGVNETVVPVYDDEPTSIISYALVSPDYHAQVSNELERQKDSGESSVSLPIFENLLSLHSFDETASESYKNVVSTDENILSLSGSRSSLVLDPLLYTKDFHARVSFTDDGSLGKVKYTVTCYYAKQFYALRKTCCPSELDFIRSLSRCKKWGAQGGKSNVFFAKTLDDRFIIKQVTKIELESFIKFAPAYFKYLSESISTGSPTCLAKILGIYQVTSKQLKGGKESKMDVLVMENLLYRRNITRLYDLKGSSRSRYNPDSSGSNKVLLDQNLIEAMPTSPIFVGNKAKRLLERAVWNDTSFLASIDVMDYSLLVGVDEEKHELVLGIIDFMRQYTWDKHLETWVKASGILGGPKNTSPTVISPIQYKKRFRKAMSAYF
ncbi:1-phosphatidylinositol-3-phosphate 5-kinase FAB1A [Vitis vinifera]|uniref:1-phosphatidylinositol-3-phosphate 5-kinase n=1 Tax=Vitis vinifera TaxID=29760 RepID=A0A438GY03_VITVI|nr:1-phosphatidylinositol-3-phosphate 5-kinase FAB1A [Vitis vinifera]